MGSGEQPKPGRARLRDLLDAMPAAVALVGSDERYVYANRLYIRSFSVADCDVEGRLLRDVLDEERYARMRRHVLVALAGDQVTYEEAANAEKGHEPPRFMVTLMPRYDAERQTDGFYVFAEAVSSSVYRHSLARAEANFSKLVESCNDAIVLSDAEGKITFLNQSAQRIFGYDLAEAIGKKVELLMPEPDASNHDAYITNYRDTGERKAIGTTRKVYGKRRSGEIFPVELSITDLHLNDHARYGAVIRDVSDTVRLQRELMEKERLSVIGITTLVFAHEVGNPLNNILLNAQLLERELTKDRHPSAKQARAVTAEVRRLARLLEEFQEYGREPRRELEPVDVASLITDLCRDQLSNVDDGVLCSVEATASLPRIHAHRDRLTQLFLNLGKNAIEAMPEGGTLTFKVEPTAGGIQVIVVDTGTGIEPGMDIFQPFKTTKPQGTGLGLAIARQIVETHGGTIAYSSERGRGTQFVVTLPALASRDRVQ